MKIKFRRSGIIRMDGGFENKLRYSGIRDACAKAQIGYKVMRRLCDKQEVFQRGNQVFYFRWEDDNVYNRDQGNEEDEIKLDWVPLRGPTGLYTAYYINSQKYIKTPKDNIVKGEIRSKGKSMVKINGQYVDVDVLFKCSHQQQDWVENRNP